MLKIWNSIVKVSLAAVLGGAFLVYAEAAERPSLRQGKDPAIEIVQINPSKGDLRRVAQKRKKAGVQEAREAEVHVVKLYVNMPPARALGYMLYIGDARVEEAGSFAEGIFFKVYDPNDFAVWRGKPQRFVFDDDVVDLGVTFPAKVNREKPEKLPELREVLKAK